MESYFIRVTRIASYIVAVVLVALAPNSFAEIDLGGVIHVQDASGKASSTAGRYDRRTGEMGYTASLKNVTQDVIVGPIYVSIENISEVGVHPINHDDHLSDGRGIYLVETDLEPGEKISKALYFVNDQRRKFNFDVDIYVLAAANPHLDDGEGEGQ